MQIEHHAPRRWLRVLLLISFCIPTSAFSISCNVLGFAAAALPPPTIRPRYTGLVGQTVGVLVWTDRGIRVDWPSLPLDTGNAIQSKLKKASAHDLDKTAFPVEPASILRYQQDHPEVDVEGVLELAPQLGVSRLLYVEVDDFSTRAAASLDLYRGSLSGTLKVIEIKDGKAKVAYEEPNIRAIYPPKSPEEG